MTLDPSTLVSLAQSAQSTPAELREQKPELFAALTAELDAQRASAVEREFESAAPDARAAVEDVDLHVADGADLSAALRTSLASRGLPDDARSERPARVRALEDAAALADPLVLERPLAEQPQLRAAIAAGEVHQIGTLAGLPENRIARVVRAASAPAQLTDATLTQLVDSGELTDDQATGIGLAAALYQLAGADDALARGLMGRVTVLRDLSALGPADLAGIVRAAGAVVPAGLGADAYGQVLAGRIARLYPTDVLLARLPRPSAERLLEIVRGSNGELEGLAKRVPGVGARICRRRTRAER